MQKPLNPGTRVTKDGTYVEYPILDMLTLSSNVIGWGKRVRIIGAGFWWSQATKLLEEYGEGAGGLARKQGQDLKDAIGDMCFLTTMVAGLVGLDLPVIMAFRENDNYDLAIEDPVKRRHWLIQRANLEHARAIDHIWSTHEVGLDDVLYEAEGYFNDSLRTLRQLAKEEGYDLEDAFSMAWDTVKDRKGRLLPNGVFVKMADAAYFSPEERVPAAKYVERFQQLVMDNAEHTSIITNDATLAQRSGTSNHRNVWLAFLSDDEPTLASGCFSTEKLLGKVFYYVSPDSDHSVQLEHLIEMAQYPAFAGVNEITVITQEL